MRSTRATIPARTEDLIALAERQGLRIAWINGLRQRGRYYQRTGVIALRTGMTERRTVSTLAHELGHHAHGDTCTEPGAEARAWRYAAELLIDPGDYAVAERLDPAAGAIAVELGVTVEIIHAYQVAARAA